MRIFSVLDLGCLATVTAPPPRLKVSGSYAMAYAPAGRAFKVRMDKITGARVKPWWFNPRDGSAKKHPAPGAYNVN